VSVPSVRLAGVAIRLGGKPVLRDFDAQFGEGVHLLVGPNGSGKTTILNLVAGVLVPDGGKVEVMGRDARAARGDVFLAPAEVPGMPWITARDLIAFSASLYKTKCAPADEARIIERLGIATFLDKRLSELSSGTARKVVVAAALAAAPPVLLFDEPTNEMDAGSVAQFVAMVAELREHVVIIATHLPGVFPIAGTRTLEIAVP
jgi:ABC-2 type transport system ATP-binding protein